MVDLMLALGFARTEPPFAAYWQLGGCQCWRGGLVVVPPLSEPSSRLASREALRTLHNARPPCAEHTALLIDRREKRGITRGLVNADEVGAALREAGFPVRRHAFSGPLLQQLEAARCARLLIGVHGAGLAWSAAMPADAALVEVTWRAFPSVGNMYSCTSRQLDAHRNTRVCRAPRYGVRAIRHEAHPDSVVLPNMSQLRVVHEFEHVLYDRTDLRGTLPYKLASARVAPASIVHAARALFPQGWQSRNSPEGMPLKVLG